MMRPNSRRPRGPVEKPLPTFSVNRYRLLKYFIPLFLALYLAMVFWKVVIGFAQDEIFPFFSWDLFSAPPGWERTENAVIVHSVYGAPVDGAPYLIPSDNPNGWKALRRTVNACRGPAECDAAVEQFLFPPVQQLAWQNKVNLDEMQGYNDVEFSIVQANINLRDIQDNLGQIASGEITRADLLQSPAALGRWRTLEGRVWPQVPENARLVAQSHFDVYHAGNTIYYARALCSPSDLDTRFFLHIFPDDPADLPRHRRVHGFENLGFNLLDYGRNYAWQCVTARDLPDYPIARIFTGQYIPGPGRDDRLWEVEFAPPPPPPPPTRRAG